MKKTLCVLLASLLLFGCFAVSASAQSVPFVVTDDPATQEDLAKFEEMSKKRFAFRLENNVTEKYLAYVGNHPLNDEYTPYGREINQKYSDALAAANGAYNATQDYRAFNAIVLEAARQLHVAELDGYRIYLKITVPDELWVYFGESPSNHVTAPALKWWQKLPSFLQWILRYLFFGWLWMK